MPHFAAGGVSPQLLIGAVFAGESHALCGSKFKMLAVKKSMPEKRATLLQLELMVSLRFQVFCLPAQLYRSRVLVRTQRKRRYVMLVK